MNDPRNRGGERLTFEWLLAAQHLVENQSQRKDIGASVIGPLEQDFRGHVGGSAARRGHGFHAFGGGVRSAGPSAAGNAEVENFYSIARRKHDVLRLDVAVDDAFFVRRLQTFTTLNGNREKLFPGNRRAEAMAKGFALNILHDQPKFAGVLQHIVDCAHVGMVERGGSLGFFEQPFAVRLSRLGVRGHALDGHMTFERGVFGGVNLPHAPGAKPPGDGKASDGGARQRVSEICIGWRWRRLDLFVHEISFRRIL